MRTPNNELAKVLKGGKTGPAGGYRNGNAEEKEKRSQQGVANQIPRRQEIEVPSLWGGEAETGIRGGATSCIG